MKKYIQKLNIKRKLSSLLKKKNNKTPSINNFAEMLKTLTEYFNTLLVLALGAWNAALRSCCRGMAGPAGAPGICTLQELNRGSRSCCCLVSVQSKYQKGSGAKKQKQDLPWGAGTEVAETPEPPLRLLHPWAAGNHSSFAWQHRAQGIVLAQLCCPAASCAQSHRKTPLTCS